MITMADGPVDNLPPNLPAYGGYVSPSGIGPPTFPVLQVRYPHARLLSISTKPGYSAMCGDAESGALSYSQARDYVCVYCSVSSVPALLDTLGARPTRLWTAHTGAGPHICSPATCAYPGLPFAADGTQHTANIAPGYDLSLLNDNFFDAWYPPAPPRPPLTHLKDDLMAKLVVASTTSADGSVKAQSQWVVSSAGKFQVFSPYNLVWSGWLAMVPAPETGDFLASVPTI